LACNAAKSKLLYLLSINCYNQPTLPEIYIDHGESSSFHLHGLPFSNNLSRDYILSIAKSAAMNFDTLR